MLCEPKFGIIRFTVMEWTQCPVAGSIFMKGSFLLSRLCKMRAICCCLALNVTVGNICSDKCRLIVCTVISEKLQLSVVTLAVGISVAFRDELWKKLIDRSTSCLKLIATLHTVPITQQNLSKSKSCTLKFQLHTVYIMHLK